MLDRTDVVLVDECVRYGLVERLERKTQDCWLQAVFRFWIRYFGPMSFLVSDQESAMLSDLVGKACEKFGIEREFGGSGGHTGAPIAERRIQLVRIGALKLWDTVVRTGLTVTQDMCVEETAMCLNLTLVYGGVTPCQGLLGYTPRDMYDPDNRTVCAAAGAMETAPDAIECGIRLRMAAKEAILQSVVEDRIATANNTKIQQYSSDQVARLTEGAKCDIWRLPDNKDDPGWRGPADLIKKYIDDSKCVVVWRGHPMLLPLRHVRPTIGFVWFFLTTAYEIYNVVSTAVENMMTLIDFAIGGQTTTMGKLYKRDESMFVYVPEDLQESPHEFGLYVRKFQV